MNLRLFPLLLTVVVLTGCSQKPHQDPVLDKPLAKVNNYVITVGDFEQEVGYLRPVFRSISPKVPLMMKAGILNDMINRELLLEEAQKLNIDKDAAFMKQVENFWRLSLIKELWDRKTREVAATVKVSDQEVKDEYEQMKKQDLGLDPYEKMAPEIKDMVFRKKVQKELEAWINSLRKNATIIRYGAPPEGQCASPLNSAAGHTSSAWIFNMILSSNSAS